MHAPLSTDTRFSRHASVDVSLVNRAAARRRIAAMDETKRALEMAEQIPIEDLRAASGCAREDRWSEYVLEYCLTAVEHLKAFAGPLGVQLLLENLPSDVATPEHLLEVPARRPFRQLRAVSRRGSCTPGRRRHAGYLCPGGRTPAGAAPERQRRRHGRASVAGQRHGDGRTGLRAAASIWAWMAPHVATLPAETVGMFEIADTQARSAEEVTRMLSDVLTHRSAFD